MDLFKLVGSIFINNSEANSDIDSTTKKAEGMASKLGSAFKSAGDSITKVGKAIAPVSAVMATALGASVKGASDFTNGMAKMSTLFDTTQTSVSDLSKEFITLSNKTGLASTELAEAGYQALSAGVDVNNAVDFVETAGNLAKAGFTSTATAVDVLTTAINAYGLEQDQANNISNKLVRTQNLGKTTVDELASSMGKVIPTASSMGVNIDNLTAGYVAMTKQGIATAESTTYMNSMLNELGKSSTTSAKILKQKTGKSFQELMASGSSLGDVLGILQDYSKETGTNFNELWGSAEAGKAGIALLTEGVDAFNDTVGIMASETDDVAEAIEKLETPSVKAQKALNQVKNSGIQLGTAFLSALQPTIDKVTGAVEKATTWFTNLDDKTKTTIATVMGIVAVASPVLMIVGKMVSGVGSLITTLGSLSASISSAGGAMALLTNPITLVVGAVIGLIALMVTLYNTNEDFRNLVNTAWENIKTKIGEVLQAVQGFIQAFIGIVQAVWNAWGDDIMNVVSNVFQFISGFIQSALDIIKAIIQTVTALIQGDWSGVWEGIKNILSSVWEGIKGIVETGLSLLGSIIQLGMTIISTTISTIWETIKSLVSAVWEGIKTVISNAITSVKTSISNGLNSAMTTVTTILNNIKAKFQSIWDGCKNIVSNAVTKLKSIMNFQWSLPHLKLPHVSISGSFSLMPPSVPHFSISWYKKAMDNPLLFTQPTLFDVNPITGTARGAGEAGDEVMIGKDTMLNMIQSAVARENGNMMDGVVSVMNMILELLQMYIPELASRPLVLDTGAVVGGIATEMDTEFGKIIKHKERGN